MDWSFLATPLGIVGLIALALALEKGGPGIGQALRGAGDAIRAWRSKGGNGKNHGEHTADLAKDLKALSSEPTTEAEVNELRGRLDQLTLGQQDLQRQVTGLTVDVSKVQDTCEETKRTVSELPEKLGEKVGAYLRERVEDERKELARDASIGAASIVMNVFRREGIVRNRRVAELPIDAARDRRRPDPDLEDV